ncbi:MAG TPA: RAMP superfamily CRISPR-associated protein [Nostocaceae cyanobacterium]|nr:RAMP superfamily CRISPR-associated protein [Nostocaceae cyanobacterium]
MNRNQNKQAKNKQTTTTEYFSIKITLLNDWHIGSGAGVPGDIDSLVQKDQNGLPYIPAKTLTGILRDSCELVAFGLDNGAEDGLWQQWVDYLFGEQPSLAKLPIEKAPIPAALSIRAAYFSEPFVAALNSKPNVKNAITFIKPGISIDPVSGCAKEDFLRFEEVVRGGAVLEAKCELSLLGNKKQKEAAYALLASGAKLVERLGGKRRRGTGKCTLVIQDNNQPAINWVDWISKNQPQTIPQVSEPDNRTNTQYITKNKNTEWVEVNLEITTKSPLIIAKRTVGNIVETLDYIPGTHLLKLIIKKLSGLGVDLSQAIAHSDIILTNATLQVNQQQGRPVPLALFYEKLGGGLDKGGKVYNRFCEDEPGGQLKGYRAGYITSVDEKTLPKYATVKMTVGTHNTIDDQVQRPTGDLGGIYSYEAIQPGTKFQASLKLRRDIANVLDNNHQNWHTSLCGDYRIGQSKKDDYGNIHIKVINYPKSTHQHSTIKNNELTVWLLSDILLRDERLRPTTDINALKAELEKHLQVKLAPKDCQEQKLSFIARTHRIDSWQVRWGLPRPSLVGLAAGSCIIFTVTEGTIKPELLAEIEARGIGERRVEGYGQICFNAPLLIQPTSTLQTPENPKNNQKEDSLKAVNYQLEDDQNLITYARIIEQAAWRDIMHQASLYLATDTQFRKQILDINIENGESKPPMSQLGSLRSVLSHIKSPADESVNKWIEHLQKTTNRAEKWPSSSLNQLRELINNPTVIWKYLSLALTNLEHKDGFSEFTITQTGEATLKQELWAEAIQILIDACIRAHKRELEKHQKIVNNRAKNHGKKNSISN